MNSLYKKITSIILLSVIYLYWNTGIHSDDLLILIGVSSFNIREILFPDFNRLHVAILGPISYYINYLQYFIFGQTYWFYDIVKIAVSFLTIYMVYLFFNGFIDRQKSLLIALFFVFFITHDAINYWVITQPYFLIIPLFLISYMLIDKNQYIKGSIAGLFGSFVAYASPPYAFGLSLIFLIQKQFKKFAIFILPQVLYIIYYFWATKFYLSSDNKSDRIDVNINIIVILKQYLLQIGTTLDAFIGPSFWLKLGLSFTQLTWMSLLVGTGLVVFFYRSYQPSTRLAMTQSQKILLIALSGIVLATFGIYSLTGHYPQMTFNLGNRVTLNTSLLISFLMVFYLMNNKKIATIIFAIFIFSVLGISDHWKAWHQRQLAVVENMKNNTDIQNFDTNKQMFFIGDNYSQFGFMAHIESEPKGWLFLATGERYKINKLLPSQFYYQNGQLIDRKFKLYYPVDESIYVYNTMSDQLLEIDKADITQYLNNQTKNIRHWLLLFDKDNPLMMIVLKLMPRLEYTL